VPYAAAGHPQSANPLTSGDGANCQRYAYAILALFNRSVPPHRSAELWADRQLEHPAAPAPLDLMLFGPAPDPFGMHVAVWMAPDQLLHLCAEVGRPAVWAEREFAARARYRCRLGPVRACEIAG
jgi:hypothetical protein